jgi:hypothetical protein
MTSAHASAPLVGLMLTIRFGNFTPQITVHSERELTVEIIEGDGSVGFSDTVEYQTITVRDDVIVLSWQEHIGSTIVHVLDLSASRAYTAITPATGDFTRMTGQIEVTSLT